ncbi:MAG: dipeptide ABC transporter ATP-binding protein [Pseudomonadota bacterium]
MTAPLLTAENLTRHYTVKGRLGTAPAIVRALDGVSFTLSAGETLAVVGESGCGKSTLARLITMIELPTKGFFELADNRIDASTPAEQTRRLCNDVQIVFQNPYGSLHPRQKIGTILQEPLVINRPKMTPTERRTRAHDMAKMVGLRPEHLERYPHMFSGGQRQRIAIARALMLSPQLLVLDEPVSALDLSIQSQILNLLTELQDRLDLAYLFISHDLSVVRHMADEVMVMYLGRAVEHVPATRLFAHPRHPYTKALLSATPVADPTRTRTHIKLEGELPSPLDVPTGCAFSPRCWKRQPRCMAERPELDDQACACFYPEGEEVTAG